MAISWKETQVINTPLSQEVIQQLDIRREILSKENSITEQELKFLHSNTGWIKVSSGVDEIQTEGTPKDPLVNKLAKENILFGGVYSTELGIKNGIFSENSSYSFSEQYGYRPMAGITSFSITNLDSFGAVRKATIDFSVNSLEDLSKFERLYLRPGFTVMLEFGHTILAKSPEENGPYYIDTNVDYYDNFFDNIEGTKLEITQKQDESTEEFEDRKIQNRNNSRLKKVEVEIKRLRKDSGYNYDAMFGRISNFQWSYNTDTTYDCSFDVMGYGSVIESLSALSSENIAGSEDDNSDGQTPIGNKFAKLLDFGIEADPFVIVKEGTDDIENPNETKVDPNITPERNAKIAAVIHYACEDGEISAIYSDTEDPPIKVADSDIVNYLGEGDVFEFVDGTSDPRYKKSLKSGYTLGKTDDANFIVVKVYKGEESVTGYIRTQFLSIQTDEVIRDQPGQYDKRFTFVPEKIDIDNGKTIRYLKRIAILPESQEYLNETYSELVTITENQKTEEKTSAAVSDQQTTDITPDNTSTEQTSETEIANTSEEVDTSITDEVTQPSPPSPFYNSPTPEEILNVKRQGLLGNNKDYGGYKKTSVKYSKNPSVENYSKPIPEPNGKFKGRLMIAFLNTETAEVYNITTDKKGKLK